LIEKTNPKNFSQTQKQIKEEENRVNLESHVMIWVVREAQRAWELLVHLNCYTKIKEYEIRSKNKRHKKKMEVCSDKKVINWGLIHGKWISWGEEQWGGCGPVD
jgi:cytidylate kinase